MGTNGYELARDVDHPAGAVILEVGVERDASGEGSTTFLSRVGPPLHVIDVDLQQVERARALANVTVHHGLAEDVLRDWSLPVSFAWLDGHDWPYEHAPAGTWDQQEREYHARGQGYSREESALSHLRIAELIARWVVPGGVIALDDTWKLPSVLDPTPGEGWNGKGGRAVPYLVGEGFDVVKSGDIYHGLVVLSRLRW